MDNFNNSDLSAILAQATNAKPKAEGAKFNKDELMKKFFNPRIDKKLGKTSEIFKARIVPNPNGGSPFQIVKFHYMQVNGKWEKLLCLDEVGQECPLCEAHQGLFQNGNKEDAKKYRPSEFYIVRVIQRGKENEGIKFWRFKKNYKGQGEFDKIINLINLGIDVLNPETGFDLNISCGLDDRGNSVVQSIVHLQPSKLAETEEEMKRLINDDTKWSDVFRPKTKEHLEDVVAGRAQYWNAELRKYVRPGEEHLTPQDAILNDNDINFDQQVNQSLYNQTEATKATPASAPVTQAPVVQTPVVETAPQTVDVNKSILADDDDDLPF